MIVTASLTLLSLLCSAVLALSGWGSPLAVAHLAFAVGIVPLIFAAMMHFVPVLTRTGEPDRRLAQLPMAAQISGLLAVAAMQGWLPYGGVYLAAAADLLFAAILLNWIARRARAALGSPHPGWRWYATALGCLMLALMAILLIPFWPSYWRVLRIFHLHLNTLGLVGLAALGTLPVLLPTALGQADPEAGSWLRRRLWLVTSGALMVATGAAIAWPFAAPGTALMLVAGLGLLGQWSRRFGLWPLFRDGVTASLLAAVIGLMVTLAAGLLHGAGLIATRPSLLAWGAGFLLPLVSGALSQLLPVWRWPGPLSPERLLMRRKLAASGAERAGLFLSAALAMLSGLDVLGGALAAFGMALFVIGVLQAVFVARSTR
ncbi:hypothetical protein [Dechloromonas sp. HYN0024]|uniref:hypothetical protein n=1 Tax=Dechloromonas sp. HYN0024 TaxID=2231055 RepID=UPI000E4404CC|nr:hypothetical protein [Dechloromonas sp. HYN0024]AXS79702.1 hypothetical protein HYN24_06545 [Dechloromonas sp. HYN0024]